MGEGARPTTRRRGTLSELCINQNLITSSSPNEGKKSLQGGKRASEDRHCREKGPFAKPIKKVQKEKKKRHPSSERKEKPSPAIAEGKNEFFAGPPKKKVPTSKTRSIEEQKES